MPDPVTNPPDDEPITRGAFLGRSSVAAAAIAGGGLVQGAATTPATAQTPSTTAPTTAAAASQPAALRLPEDLATLVGNPALLKKPEGLTVACYTFPNYHASAIHDRLYGPGWTEYNLMRQARPWFEGHVQPRGPLLGELDESLPSTWERYNRLAKNAGIDAFIWDWYWYDGQPALHEALENGFLRAANTGDVKFACMWTDHDWSILYPTTRTDGTLRNAPSFRGPHHSPAEIWRSIGYILTRYCHLPNYWRIDERPVLTMWDANAFIAGAGGLEKAKQMVADLRDFARRLGHKGLWLHCSSNWSPQCDELGFDTRGHYNLTLFAAHQFQPNNTKLCDYGIACADVASKLWPEGYKNSRTKYLPVVSPGWDTSPRYVKTPGWSVDQPRVNRHGVIFRDENPGAFKALVQAAFAYLNQHPDVPPIMNVGVWNEWTEGQYLLPDSRLGYGMLDALAEAMGKTDIAAAHGR